MFWRFDTFHLIETTYGSISVGVICQAARPPGFLHKCYKLAAQM